MKIRYPMHRPCRHRKGFSLVELLVVILIIVVLAAFAFAMTARMRKSADQAVVCANLRQIGLALVTYTAENNRFPSAPTPQGDPAWDRCIIPHLGYTGTLTGSGILKPSEFRGLESIAKIFASPADKEPRAKDTYKRSFAVCAWTTNWSDGKSFRGWKDLPYNKGVRYSMLNSPEKAAMVVQCYEGTTSIPNHLGNIAHCYRAMGGPQKLLGNDQQVLFADGHIEKLSARMKLDDFIAKYWPGTVGNVN